MATQVSVSESEPITAVQSPQQKRSSSQSKHSHHRNYPQIRARQSPEQKVSISHQNTVFSTERNNQQTRARQSPRLKGAISQSQPNSPLYKKKGTIVSPSPEALNRKINQPNIEVHSNRRDQLANQTSLRCVRMFSATELGSKSGSGSGT